MTRRLRYTALLALAACAPRQAPAPAPAPAAVPAGSQVAAADSGAARARVADSADNDTTRADGVELSPAEVVAEATKVFGDSIAPGDTATIADSAGAADDLVTWDIDVRSWETHERVEHYVAIFSGPARDRIAERLRRGSRYEPMIRTKFREAGLPEDMYYLALIESNYNPHAYSRAAAVGMWQFMTATARGMGMRVDWWVDERRDPVRSTDGAIRFLKYLNEQFGSMYLAAAAYNGGPGRISRGLNRFADDLDGQSADEQFFALAEKGYLRAETKNYVPQLIAAAIVAKDPRRYGLRLDPLPPFSYDSVRVPPATPLAAVAAAAGATMEELHDLNPHILRGATPPRDSLFVRVPPGRRAVFDSAFVTLPAEERTAFTRAVTKQGDTMARLAARYRLTTKQLAWYNPKLQKSKKTGRVVPGQTVLVPARAVVLAALDVPDPAVERYGAASRRIHVVRRGETLGGIARRYGTSVATLKRLNGLRKSVIYAGQALVVKGTPRKARPAAGKGAVKGRRRSLAN
jgi:membrane-bound lytic murein transglycosylase D